MRLPAQTDPVLSSGVKRSFSIREQIRILTIKKPAHPGNKSPEWLALNSSFHTPPQNVLRSSVGPHITLEAFSMVAGGYKRTNITCRRAVKQFDFSSD